MLLPLSPSWLAALGGFRQREHPRLCSARPTSWPQASQGVSSLSAEHVAWVYRHSPARGTVFAVHQAIADSVNDQHQHEFWMAIGKLAKKSRTSRRSAQAAVASLVDDGYLEVLDEGQLGRPNRYRFLFPDVAVVYETRSTGSAATAQGVRSGCAPGSAKAAHRVRSGCALTQEEPKEGTQEEQPRESTIEARRLCELLATSIEEHRAGSDRPAVTERWLRDMRLLLERGPRELAKPEAIAVARVERGISFLFRNLADVGADGFCWADQVRSPAALRKHWTRIRDAARALDRARMADLHSHDEGRQESKRSEAGELLRRNVCDDANCHDGWLEDERSIFDDGPQPPVRPCPTCRPTQAIA